MQKNDHDKFEPMDERDEIRQGTGSKIYYNSETLAKINGLASSNEVSEVDPHS